MKTIIHTLYEDSYIQPYFKGLFSKFQPKDSKEKFDGFIPINRLEITYSASSGPGGQNVNKVRNIH